MSIAIIVITHGSAASELRYSAEMIVGKGDNFGCIHFLTEDNGDTLSAKIRTTLETMDCQTGVLFLVDLWGGTPFNTAGMLLAEKENYQVVTGVNVPMLLQVLIERETCDDVARLAEIAAQAGVDGVKVLNLPQKIAAEPEIIPASDEPMTIALARIDDRLVHGKVITSWLKAADARRILVVNDAAAHDATRIALFQHTAPAGVSADVLSRAEMIARYEQGRYGGERVVLLFTRPADVLHLLAHGVPITHVNIGSMAAHQGTTPLTANVALTADDLAALRQLAEKGVALDVRPVPHDSSPDVAALLQTR